MKVVVFEIACFADWLFGKDAKEKASSKVVVPGNVLNFLLIFSN